MSQKNPDWADDHLFLLLQCGWILIGMDIWISSSVTTSDGLRSMMFSAVWMEFRNHIALRKHIVVLLAGCFATEAMEHLRM